MLRPVVEFGDRAWLVVTGDLGTAHHLAGAVQRAVAASEAPPAVAEAVVGMGTVVVHLDTACADRPTDERSPSDGWPVGDWLAELLAGSSSEARGPRPPASAVDVPTVFDGPDLDEVAALAATDPAGVVSLLTSSELEVAFVGFSPGFPYLVGLPEVLARVPRRPTPRTEVPAGSVALAGGFAGIYPQATPGGWHLVGRTSLRLFDPRSPPFATLRPGDRVRLVPLASGRRSHRPPARGSKARRPLAARGARAVEVLEPGLLTTVQDAGRPGVAAAGVPRAGPCDRDSMWLANRLVGNDDGAPALEVTASGPRLAFGSAAQVAVVGVAPGAVEVAVDGRPASDWALLPVASGQVLSVGRVREGFRAYLAASGGFLAPRVAGSRSSDLLSGLGPGPLVPGDRLPLGAPGRPRGSLTAGEARDLSVVRLLPGPHDFPPAALEALLSTTWRATPDSSRVGICLDSPGRRLPPGPPVASTGMVTGAVQVPPDGRPIVLMPDHATVGGYPVLAVVADVDVDVLGQLRPGDAFRFLLVDRSTAMDAARRRERALADRVQGWYPTRSGT